MVKLKSFKQQNIHIYFFTFSDKDSKNAYFHCSVLIRCFMSCCRKAFTGLSESSFGVASKYKAPLKKCFTLSERKNCLAVATLPDTLKKTPVILLGVCIRLSSME